MESEKIKTPVKAFEIDGFSVDLRDADDNLLDLYDVADFINAAESRLAVAETAINDALMLIPTAKHNDLCGHCDAVESKLKQARENLAKIQPIEQGEKENVE